MSAAGERFARIRRIPRKVRRLRHAFLLRTRNRPSYSVPAKHGLKAAKPGSLRVLVLEGLLGVILIAGLFAPLLAPYGEAEIVGGPFEPWSATHWLGTDQLGRDFFSRLLFGLRNSLGLAIAATALSFLIGVNLGLLAASGGRLVDQVLSRLVDALMALPALIFALVMLAIVGTGSVQLVAIIGLLDSTRVFRLTRALALRETALDYVEAARLRGEHLPWIMWREILPNIRIPLAAEAGMRFSFVFLTIATLAFLGLGLQPPAADLGSLVRENAQLITYGDITPLIPAALIAAIALIVNLLIDALEQDRDILALKEEGPGS